MNAFLLVGLGGAIGSMTRFGVGRMLGQSANGWPMATFAVNIVGGLLMGLLAGLLLRMDAREPARLLLGVGFLGGFTTFSAFSLELLLLIERGQHITALGYATASVILALVAVMVGMSVGRFFA